MLEGMQIEVFTAAAAAGPQEQLEPLADFRSLFAGSGRQECERVVERLRQCGFDKPLELQRRVVPLVRSALAGGQSFLAVQGPPQSGKTSALVLGILAELGLEPGLRAVVLSTCAAGDFAKCFDVCSHEGPARLECFEALQRRVCFEGLAPDPEAATAGVDPLQDLQRLCSALATGMPCCAFGHPARMLPLLREAPAWGVDLARVQALALDDAEEAIRLGLIDEVCEVCTLLRHFAKQRLRHVVLSRFLSHEAKSMVRCLRNFLVHQRSLFGIRAHRTQARAKSVNHYYAVAKRARWPAMLSALHHALSLPSGIIFDDTSPEARAQARAALRAHGLTASVWNGLREQGSGARAAARAGAAAMPRGSSFHLMPSDIAVLRVDLPQVRCVLHFEVPRWELSIYGLRLLCLEQADAKRAGRKGLGGRSLSVLFVEEESVVRELEKTFHVKMPEVPAELLAG